MDNNFDNEDVTVTGVVTEFAKGAAISTAIIVASTATTMAILEIGSRINKRRNAKYLAKNAQTAE
jgi:hypothetical protein